VAVSSLVFLTGCFDLLEEIWLETTGGGRLRVEISLPKTLLAMGRLGGEDVLVSVREDAANVKAELEKDPDITRFDYRSEEDRTSFRLIYEVATRDATKLSTAQERMLAALARRASSSGSGSGKLPVQFTIQRRYGVVGHVFEGVVAGERDADKSSGGREVDLAEAMAGALLGGHGITVRVHAPAITSSNGELNADRNTAEWKIPFSAMVKGDFRQELRAETLAVDWKMSVVIVAVGLVLFGMVLGRLTGRRR
jgi:hypothetical protein